MVLYRRQDADDIDLGVIYFFFSHDLSTISATDERPLEYIPAIAAMLILRHIALLHRA